MKITPRRRFGLLFIGIWIVNGGCGGSSSAPGRAESEGEVSGTAKMQGKPVTSGEVLFEPTGGPAADTAPRTAFISEGSYNVTLIPGQYRATVQKSQGGKAPKPMGKPKELDVKSGPRRFDIDL
jgi:hypothetical protein